MYCVILFLDIVNVVNSDRNSASTEANNSDPSSAKADGQQASNLEMCSHGSTEASGCSNSIEIDDCDNAEQGSAAENDYSGTDLKNKIVHNFDDSHHNAQNSFTKVNNDCKKITSCRLPRVPNSNTKVF